MSERASPDTIGSPRPPAPMKAASVAVPTPITAAVRIPAMMIGLASAFLELLQTCVPQLLRSLDRWSPGGHLERIYGDVGSIDFSREVLARVPNRLLVLRDAESGWTDLGSPRRVVDVVTRHGLRPQWLSSDYRPTALASSF